MMTLRSTLAASAASLSLAACASAPPPLTPAASVTVSAPFASAAAAPARDYLLFAASEATDRIALIRFGPSGIRIERENVTGIMPADVD